MALKKYHNRFVIFILLSCASTVYALDNLTRNDPYPLYSSLFYYSYLATEQKSHLMNFDYTYPCNRFYIAASPFRQSACYGRNQERDAVNLGDMNGRWNMLGLFYDPALAAQLYNILDFNPCINFGQPDTTGCQLVNSCTCCQLITDPRKSDPNKEFGFFSIPLLYRKYGVRFESEILLIDRCYYGVGLRIQFGVANVRQNVIAFEDFTCQALGFACPGYDPAIATQQGTSQGACGSPATAGSVTCAAQSAQPGPQVPPAVAIPYIDLNTLPVPPCPPGSLNADPLVPDDCVPLIQKFQPCVNQTCCFGYSCNCKELVIDKIMMQKDKIFDFLGIDTCSFNRFGLEDLRLSLFWREIFIINEEDERYPRVLFMPFIEAGVGIPLDKPMNPRKSFALPVGNNDHVSAGLFAGWTIDFLDTISLSFQGGFTKFFKRAFCDVSLPTNKKESGIFPYRADVDVTPGTTWHFGAGFNAQHFIDNLSFWIEWMIIAHRPDDIHVCRSFIPSTSIYFQQGFLTDYAECLTQWEAQVFNTGFNYDLSPNLTIGVVWQAPFKQVNAYSSGTVLGSVIFTY